MIKLPYQQTDNRQLNQFQQSLQKQLQPIINTPQAKTIILNSITLKSGSINNINHTLNRPLVGWYLVRLRGQAIVWDSQDSNTTPDQTLALNTSANVVADIAVF